MRVDPRTDPARTQPSPDGRGPRIRVAPLLLAYAPLLLAYAPLLLAYAPLRAAYAPLRAAYAALLLAAAPLLLACSPYRLDAAPTEPDAVTQPFTTYIDGMATVCVIRSAQIALAVTFTVHDNNLLVGATRGPTYFCYRAQPGRHRINIASDDGEQRFDVLLEPRARYYLDQRLRFEFGSVYPQAAWVDETTAAQLLQRSEHRVLQGAPASEHMLTGTEVVATLPEP